jgi:protein gp37
MKNSHIEWTDHTFNPWIGCTKVSPGCAHCYAEARDQRFAEGKHWGEGAPRQRTSESNWRQPLKWNREAARAEEMDHGTGASLRRPRVFCASLADWLDDEVPIEWLADLLRLIQATPNLDWLLLTKRPENWAARFNEVRLLLNSVPNSNPFFFWLVGWIDGTPPANVWVGTSVEDQARADDRIPKLLQIPACIRFLSCEPLLERIGLYEWLFDPTPETRTFEGRRQMKVVAKADSGLHWVIAGGESGANARPMHPKWARSLRDQCAAAGVPFFFKQWGEWQPYTMGTAYCVGFRQSTVIKNGEGATGWPAYLVGKKAAGRLLDGREWNEFPKAGVVA